MSKKTETILKIIAIVVAVAAAVTLIVVYRQQIKDFFTKLSGKFRSVGRPKEFDDFADV